jgi:hypothetical protein
VSRRALLFARAIGGFRAGVGVALIAKPQIARASDPTAALLVRTIGVRDVALGLGALFAGKSTSSNWIRAGLVSDVGDLAIGLRSAGEIGPSGWIAVAAPIPVIAADIAQLRAARR